MFKKISFTLPLLLSLFIGTLLPLRAEAFKLIDLKIVNPIKIIKAYAVVATDSDDDNIVDATDNCPFWHNPDQEDENWNKIGDVCEEDYDQDLILDDGDGSGSFSDNPCQHGELQNCDDNCPLKPNPMQSNLDNDKKGDACDIDIDGDGLLNETEISQGLDPSIPDTDGDGVIDSWDCRPLDDQLGYGPECSIIVTPAEVLPPQDQTPPNSEVSEEVLKSRDSDSDGLSDYEEISKCMNPNDIDSDKDGVVDTIDNCPIVENPDQDDENQDKVGDFCQDDYDGDGALNGQDNCQCGYNPEQFDEDQDGTGNFCDADHLDFGVIDLKTIQGGSNANLGCQLQIQTTTTPSYTLFWMGLVTLGLLGILRRRGRR